MEPNYKIARDMAKKILRDHKIKGVPTDLQKICDSLGWEYVELDDPNELDGAVLEMEGQWVAMLNKGKPFVRARFTLAHELGHIFLNNNGYFLGSYRVPPNSLGKLGFLDHPSPHDFLTINCGKCAFLQASNSISGYS